MINLVSEYKILKNCICGITFISYKKENRKYCSRKCSYNGKIIGKEKNICICGNVFESYKSENRKYCSFNCSVVAHTGSGNQFFGRKQTLKNKIMSSRNNKGKKRSRESIEKQFKTRSDMWMDGRLNLNKQYSKSWGTHNGIKMRCINSEGVFARQLDRENIKWIYEPKRFNLSWCTYTPDFYLPEFDIWIEIKGWLKDIDRRKIESFRKETGKTLVLIMQEELESKLYKEGGQNF